MAVARVGRGSLRRKSRQHPGGWSSTDAYKRGAQAACAVGSQGGVYSWR